MGLGLMKSDIFYVFSQDNIIYGTSCHYLTNRILPKSQEEAATNIIHNQSEK